MIQGLKHKSEFSRNVLTLMTGTTIAQAIPVAISPILTRIYTPEDFGLLALYMALAAIVAVIATGRYELAIMLPKREKDAINIVFLSFIVAVLVSFICLLIVWGFNAEIVALLNSPKIANWLYFIPLTILLTGAYQSLNYWNNRKKKYKNISNSKIIQSTVMGGSQLSLDAMPNTLIHKFSSFGLIFGYIIAQFSAFIFLVQRFIKFDRGKIYLVNTNKIVVLAKRYKNFPLVNSWSGLLNTASLQVPIFVLTSLFSSAVTGFFSIAQRILQMPMSLIGSAIGQVYFQKASEVIADREEIKKITYNLNKKLLYIGIFPVSITLVAGDYLFAFVLGEPWIVAGEYAQYLSVWIFFVFISSPLSHLMTLYEKHIEAIYFNLLLFLSRIAALYAGWFIFNDASQAILIYGIVGAIIWAGFVFYLMNLAHISLFETLKQLTPFLSVIGVSTITGIYV